MNKKKAIKTGKASAILLWALLKASDRLSWVIFVALLSFIGGLLLAILSEEGNDSNDESEWWWYQNHGDPMHLYDKDDKT